MSQPPRVLERLHSQSSSAPSVIVTGSSRGEDMLREEAALRLKTVALVYGGLWLLMAVTRLVLWSLGLEPPGAVEGGELRMTVLSLVAMGFSAHTARVAHKCAKATSRQLTWMGLTFGVVAAFLISLAQYGLLGARNAAMSIPWACMWIVFFPVLVPATLKQTMGAVAVAILTTPLALGIWALLDGVQPIAQAWVMTTIASIVAGVLAKIPHKVVTRLHQHFETAEKAAKRLGSYQLEERLGVGGMGEVWRARHRMLRRPAAVKLIKSEVFGSGTTASQTETAMRRFEREAQVTAELQSPHTVRLFDFGRSAGGQFYYVMELLEGLDLETLVERFGPLEPERVIHLMRQACQSLEEAHQRGLIHRDIKPANIYVCRFALEHDFVKVLDFGLVTRDTNVKTSTELGLTMDGAISGTPAYMPPEMCLGEGKVDARSDVYALGCVAYWLLTGQLVFESDSAMRMLLAHINTAPVAPSERSELPIPPELDALLLACLAKDPNERPQTAAELSLRLEAIPTDGPWNEARASRWWDTHRPEVAATPSGEAADAPDPIRDAATMPRQPVPAPISEPVSELVPTAG